MIELIRYDLRNKDEWDDFYGLFSTYLSEVCGEEEYKEEIDDLHNDELNAEMIDQTLQEHDPYFIMRIVENKVCVGLISYSYHEECSRGFINNFYVCPECRSSGVGSKAYQMVENHLRSLGANYIELEPAKMAESFYIRNGFEFSRTSSDGETVFGKVIQTFPDKSEFVEENMDSQELYELAMKHIYGDGVSEDNDLAFKLLNQAHEMGHIEATYNLGICYHYGFGTSIDLAKAFELYLESANAGYGKGMELVGRFYNRGIHVEQNREQAKFWLAKAICSSDTDAVEEAKKELSVDV